MSAAAEISGRLAIDANALSDLKRQARSDPQAGLKQAAQQFEGVFLRMVLKSMRDATPRDALFDSDQSRMFQDMFDQQLAQTLAARGATGLAAIIEKQLARTLPSPSGDAQPAVAAPVPDSRFSLGTLRGAGQQLVGPAKPPSVASVATASDAPGGFVGRVWPHALDASRTTGIPAQFIIGHAALESGWGRGEMRLGDGTPSYNLFNVKAGSGWNGKTVDVTTTEFVAGTAQRRVERFRAYASYADAFADYASLLKSNPRYAKVIGQQDGGGFARALQQAGYATDPMYADKLTRVIGSATLRQGLSG
jgi:flagellar protein FlgJ